MLRWSLLFLCAPLVAQAPRDFYPAVRSLLIEAESAASKIVPVSESQSQFSRAGHLYARAGYLDDAARAYTRAAVKYNAMAAPTAVYGDRDAAIRLVDRETGDRSLSYVNLARIFWRLGDKQRAAATLDKASAAAAAIPDPGKKKTTAAIIAQLRSALPDDPPIPLSAEPLASPVPVKPAGPPEIPPFPITADGFRDNDPKVATARAAENGPFLTKLYAYMERGDRDGLLQHARSAATLFQKTLALVSIEHILIQANMPDAAEEYAREIPENTPDCALAKAEALSAAASAWARKGDMEHARSAFAAALEKLDLVADLPFGQLKVAIAIAVAQADAGLVATSRDTFALASRIAAGFPLLPKSASGARLRPVAARHFRPEAYESIFTAQLRVRDVGAASRTAVLWRAAGGSADDVAEEFFRSGFPDDALQYARAIEKPNERARAFLWLAEQMLEHAGAPSL
jgi:tetratricopeptide (TPR) repeat protein